jgi:gentisate 1,2-dioxygenase
MNVETKRRETVEVGYDELCGALAARDLQGLWSLQTRLMPELPLPTTRPWLWKWSTLLPLAERAGDVVTIDRGGDRRVLALANPGLGGLPFTSTTLWGAIQFLGPGESAPAHRHSPSAIRFVMQGRGVYTTVNGDACDMEEGDLILTPNWNWHDHNNEGDQPMVWFDGLDLPLVTTLESIFFENHAERNQPVEGRNLSEQRFVAPGLRDASQVSSGRHSPLLRYRWADTDRALTELERTRSGASVAVEYTDPTTGRGAVPTFRCEMQRLRPGLRTETTRRTGSSIVVVFRGAGETVIGGTRFPWQQGDIFVIPSWATVDSEASEPADLFVISDRPVLELLHLYAEEAVAGPQTVTTTFTGKA